MPEQDSLSSELLSAIEKFQISVHSWNQWRSAHPTTLVALVKANFKGADLRGSNFKKADLRGASLAKASLAKTSFRGADLSRSKLSQHELSMTNLGEMGLMGELFRTDHSSVFGKVLLRTPDFVEIDSQKVDLSGLDLRGADFGGVVLIEADLSEAILDEADFSQAVLEEADLRGADLGEASLSEAVLDEARLDRADLRGVCLKGTNLRRAWLTMADFRGVDLSRANLYEAKLIRTNFSGANLTEATLSKAYLAEADFSRAILIRADLSEADLSETNFGEAILVEANLRDTTLIGTNFDEADLSEATLMNVDFSGGDLRTVKLNKADLRYADFSRANLSGVILGRAHCTETYFNGANLNKADLRQADLYRADLSEATLRSADLGNANFERANVLGTDFTKAVLTGACIKDWNTNRATRLEGVQADYVYLNRSPNTDDGKIAFSARRPEFGVFKPGEFSILFQQAIDTLDLVFIQGIDWQAFLKSFQELCSQYSDEEISVQAIERKSSGAFLVRLEVPAASDKSALESTFKELYPPNLAALETQYEERLKLQGVQIEDAKRAIEIEKQEKALLLGIMKTMAENQSPKFDLRGSNIGSVVDTAASGSRVQSVLHNYPSVQRQNLAEAAHEIQVLLEHLSKNYEMTEVPGQAVKQIKQNPQMRERVIGALKNGGKTALEKLIDHPAVSIVLAAIEGASKP